MIGGHSRDRPCAQVGDLEGVDDPYQLTAAEPVNVNRVAHADAFGPMEHFEAE